MLTKAATHLRPLIRLSHQNLPADAFSSNPSILQHLHNSSNPSSTAVAHQAGANPAGPSGFAGASGGGRHGYQGPFRSLLHLQTTNPAQPLTTSNTASDEDDLRLQSLRAHRPTQTPAKAQSTASKTPTKLATTRVVLIEDKPVTLLLDAAPSKRRGSISYPRAARTKADLFTVGIGRTQRPPSATRVYSTHAIPRASSSHLLVTVPSHATPKPQTRVSAGRVRSQSTSAVPLEKPAFVPEDVEAALDQRLDLQFFQTLLKAIRSTHRVRVAQLVARYRSPRDGSAPVNEDIQVNNTTPPESIPLPRAYNKKTYNLCLDGLFIVRQAGDSIAPILETYNEMLERDILPNGQTYAIVIRALCARDYDIQDATQRFESEQMWGDWTSKLTQRPRSPDFPRDSQPSADALETYKHEGNFDSAMKLFRAAVDYQAKAFNFREVVYHDLLQACAAHGDTDAAVEVYAHAEKHEVGDPRSLLRFVMEAYGKKGDVEGIDEVWKEYRQLAESAQLAKVDASLDTEKRGLVLTLTRRMWTATIAAYINAGVTDKAAALLQQMQDAHAGEVTDEQRADPAFPPQINGAICEPVIQAYINKNDINAAHDFYISHKDTTIVTTPTISKLISRLIYVGRIDDALAAANEIVNLREASYDHVVLRRVTLGLVYAATEARVAGNLELENKRLSEAVEFSVQACKVAALRLTKVGVEAVARAFTEAGDYEGLSTVLKNTSPPRDARLDRELLPFLSTVTSKPDIPITIRIAVAMALERHHCPTPIKELAELLSRYREARVTVQSAKMLELTPAMWKYMIETYTSVAKAEDIPVDDIQSELLAFVDDLVEVAGKVSQGGVLSELRVKKGVMDRFGYVLHKHFGRERAVDSLTKICDLTYATELLKEEDQKPEAASFKMPPSPQLSGSSLSIETPPDSPTAAPQLRIDAKLSSRVDTHLMQNAPITPLDAYARVKEGMASNGIVPYADTLGRLVQSLGRIGQVEKVRELYGLAQTVLQVAYADPVQQSRAWFSVEDNMLIACCHLGFLEEAGLHRARILENGGVPTADAYASMIANAKDTTDDASVARELFDESQRLAVRPHLYLYNTIISKLSKARKAELALELFVHMKEAGIRPSSVTYGAVINACCRVADAESAATLFNEMINAPNFKPRVPPYNTMMQLYLYTRPSRELVLHYYAAMQQARVPPSAHTYKLLLDAYGTLEPVDMPGMERVFEELVADKNVKVQGTHWASLILGYGTGMRDVDRAVQTFESISSHPSTRVGEPLDPVVWEALLNVFGTSGRVDDLAALFERMKQSGVRGTAYVYNALIAGYSAAGRIDEAREVFEAMGDSVMGVAAPNNHPMLLTSSGQAKPSTTTEAPTSIVYREPSTYEAMIRGNLQAGDRAAAEQVYARMEERMYPLAVSMRARAILDEPTL